MFKRKPKAVAVVVTPQPDPELVAALERLREVVRKIHEKADQLIATVATGQR